MKYICPAILLIFSILSFYFAFKILCSRLRKDIAYRLLSLMCIGSGIWSVGFGLLIIQTSPETAYRCRAFGLIGTFLYLIMVQFLVCYISKIPKGWAWLFNGLSLLGIPICVLAIDRRQSVYFPGVLGMTYSFVPGFANNMYSAYTIMLFIILTGISIYMVRFSRVKRLQFFGKSFLLTVLLMLAGSVLDTLLPFLGIPAIPGSTMTQFWGLLVVLTAVRVNDRSRISVENLSQFIYYSSSTPILAFDADYRLQIANDAASEFLNIDPVTLSQKAVSVSQLFQLDRTSAFDFQGNSISIDSLCERNQLYCNLTINKIQDRFEDIIGYIIIITDLTERMKTMQKLEEAKVAAEAANRSKSSFLANMSHEIRTPMNAILGFSELILKMDIDPKVREYVADIKGSCQNLLAVINDILDISKLDSGKMELSCGNFYLCPLLHDAFHIIDIQARKKGLRFTMDVDPQTPRELYGDKTRIRGILINILNNAVKYTATGSVSFIVKVLEKNESTITLAYIISDTGIGITEDAKEHLFESFTRFDEKANREIEGTGLGLSIVNGYVQLMGGTIDVDSTYGKGSTFTVTLTHQIVDARPIEGLTVCSQETSALNTREIKIRDTSVLVTDDNQINLKVIKGTLEYYGFSVDTAASGADAIDLCRRKEYDLIFMDQMMPGMDGVEAMQHIRSISGHYAAGGAGKIIVLTANAIAGMRKELMEKGFDEYLGKPVNFRELERIIGHFVPADKIITVSEQAETSDSSPVTFPPQLNVKDGINHCGGDNELYVEVLHMVHDSAPDQLNKLKALLDGKDYENYTVHIHSIKGQLLNIGDATLAAAAKELEYASREGRYGYLEEQTNTFIQNYEELLTQLESAFAVMQ